MGVLAMLTAGTVATGVGAGKSICNRDSLQTQTLQAIRAPTADQEYDPVQNGQLH